MEDEEEWVWRNAISMKGKVSGLLPSARNVQILIVVCFRSTMLHVTPMPSQLMCPPAFDMTALLDPAVVAQPPRTQNHKLMLRLNRRHSPAPNAKLLMQIKIHRRRTPAHPLSTGWGTL